ncbi:MAG: guanylate kinase [Syntrophothermus sp.]
MKGKAIIISAPSGAGKTTIVKSLLSCISNLEFSISCTSRPIRAGETDGKDYTFISAEAFRQDIGRDRFVEWQEVYPGSFYGTPKKEVERIWAKGNTVIFEVDVIGGMNLKKYFGDHALSVFIRPPKQEDLEHRLRARGTEDEAALQKRIGKATYELGFAGQFDRVIINDNLEQACSEACAMVRDFING